MSENKLPTEPGNWKELPVIRKDDPLIWQDTVTQPKPRSEAPCLLCAKPCEVRPSIGDVDQVCDGCRKTYGECAVIVCEKCRRIHAKIKPGVQSDGFVVKPRAILHLYDCPVCARGPVMTSEAGHEMHLIREIEDWKANVRPSKLILPAPRLGGLFMPLSQPKRIK